MEQKIAEQRKKGVLLNAKEYESPKMGNAYFRAQIQGMSLEQELDIALDQTLFSRM